MAKRSNADSSLAMHCAYASFDNEAGRQKGKLNLQVIILQRLRLISRFSCTKRRYGIMIGGHGHYPLPGRLFRYGTNFDFMISFQNVQYVLFFPIGDAVS